MKTNITYTILAALALSSAVHAVSPPPDGGYPNFNTAEGDFALQHVTSGALNAAIGYQALYENTSGDYNTAIGEDALYGNFTGSDNTAIGYSALVSNDADNNTADGANALTRNTTGAQNTASGAGALQNNTTASNNTATGFDALFANSTGADNTAMGASAMARNTTGFNNTAAGFQALFSNNAGFNNTASGVNALFSNTTGFNNSASGFTALQNNTTGNSNTAEGDGALATNTTGSNNTACGISALLNNTTGKNNIALGASAGSNLSTGGNNIDIGTNVLGNAGEANTIRVGKQGTQKATFIAGIRGVTVASGVGVIVGTTGQLGTVQSSARFKDDIKPMDKASETILALKPVTFRYKEEIDPDGIPQFGLVAEEVEKVNPDLVARDEEGKIMSVRYEAVNAMLLNEFLKEHRRVQELKSIVAKQEATNAEQQQEIKALTASLKEQASQIQKVSAQLEADRLARPLVASNR